MASATDVPDRERVELARSLLRLLAIGLSVHRLYPDDPSAPSFADAAGRIAAAVGDALVSGPVRLEVRSGRFVVDGTPVTDAAVDRLAHACFERRVEHLGFDDVPCGEELWTAFALLTRDPGELARDGGMARLLAAWGSTAIAVAAGVPAPTAGEPVHDELLNPPDRDDATDDATDDAPIDGAADLRLEPGESGAALYARLAARSDSLSADGSVRSSFYQRAAWVVDELPAAERAVFGRRLIDDLTTEAFAERYAGHLTDLALAELITTVARCEGADPAALAAEVGTAAERHANLRRLLGSDDDLAGSDPVAGDERDGIEDTRLRSEFPMTATDERQLASLALIDVLLAGPREEHLDGILANATRRLREAVCAGAHGPIRDLLGALETATRLAPRELTERLGRPKTEALTPEVVLTAASDAARQRRVLDPQLFLPFGPGAITAVLGAVAREPRTPVTERLAEVLLVLAAPCRPVLQAALEAQPPEVVVALAPVLSRTDVDTVALLSRSAARADPAVIVGVVDALGAVGEPEAPRAAASLVAIARRATAPELRHHCLAVLARLPAAAGGPHLEALAAGGSAAVLPWRSRRRARRLARDLGGQR